MQTGKAALQSGDYLAAVSAFREAVQKDKKNPEAYVLLGTALLKADSAVSAEAVLIQARELDPANVQVYILLGDAYWNEKIPAAAIDQYKKATDLDSTNVVLFMKLGAAYKKTLQYTDAARAYSRVVSIDSINGVALGELSSIFMRGKQYANAAVFLERLVRLKPDSFALQIQYAKVLGESKNYVKLIPVAEKIIERDASQSEIGTFLAEAYIATGQDTLAVKAFLGKNPDSLSENDLVKFGQALKRMGDFERAADILGRAYRRDSTRCDVPYDLGSLYLFRLKRYADAVEMFDRKIECDTAAGYQFASHLNSGMAFMQLKKFKEGKSQVLTSLGYKPDNLQAWQTLAQIYGQLEETDSEIVAYKKVIDLASAANTNGEEGKYDKQLGEAGKMIGMRYLIDATNDKDQKTNKEKWAKAFEWLKKALQYNTKDCDLVFYTGVAAQNSNKRDEAKKYYCKVIEACPKSKQADTATKYLDALGLKCGE